MSAPRAGLYALGGYLALYAALLAAMWRFERYEPFEALFVLCVYGVTLSALAWWATRGAQARDLPVRRPRPETAFVLAYFLALSLFTTFGFDVVRGWSQVESVQAVAIAAAKLVSFVLVPFLFMRGLFGYHVRDFVDGSGLRGHWRPVIVVGAGLVAFQLVFGRALRDLRVLDAGPGEIGVAAILALAGMTLEAGVVEEYFFRVLMLERLVRLLRSDAPALVITSLLFGLAHAPGLYLRPHITGEGVGGDPSLLFAVGYSVVVLSVAGFLFGTLWLRTRNFLLVALLHGLNDAVPATAGMIHWMRS